MGQAHTPVTAVPVQVYVPPPSGTPHVILFNEGTSTVYVGQAGVTPANGILVPAQTEVKLPAAAVALYAVSGANPTSTSATTTAPANSAATSLPVTSGSGLVNGSQIQVGSGSAAENVTVVSGGGTTTLTITALNYDHKSGATVTLLSAVGSCVRSHPAAT
jgi:hypothetical protein